MIFWAGKPGDLPGLDDMQAVANRSYCLMQVFQGRILTFVFQ